MKKKLSINNKLHEYDASEDTPLLWVLRDHLGLTGTKYACGIAACGSCTVMVDGQAVRSCVVPASAFNEKQQITTIESDSSRTQNALKKAWTELSVAQCGYCQPGMVMAATALLENNAAPSDQDIDEQLTNICRCGTYQLVRAAVKRAAKELNNG